jgi:hypothetical protein
LKNQHKFALHQRMLHHPDKHRRRNSVSLLAQDRNRQIWMVHKAKVVAMWVLYRMPGQETSEDQVMTVYRQNMQRG